MDSTFPELPTWVPLFLLQEGPLEVQTAKYREQRAQARAVPAPLADQLLAPWSQDLQLQTFCRKNTCLPLVNTLELDAFIGTPSDPQASP